MFDRLREIVSVPKNLGHAIRVGVELGFAEFTLVWEEKRSPTLFGMIRNAGNARILMDNPTILSDEGNDGQLVCSGVALVETFTACWDLVALNVGTLQLSVPELPQKVDVCGVRMVLVDGVVSELRVDTVSHGVFHIVE